MKRGYPLENRSYQSDDINYKFTGKQRDAETGGACPDMLLIGNYFGARYYDARIGRWGSVEPLLEKYISFSPYVYCGLNPINFADIDGRNYWITGPERYQEYAFSQIRRGSSLKLYFDYGTGQLRVWGRPNLAMLSESDRILYNAIIDPNKDYFLNCLDHNTNENRSGIPVFGDFKGGGNHDIYVDDIQEMSRIT